MTTPAKATPMPDYWKEVPDPHEPVDLRAAVEWARRTGTELEVPDEETKALCTAIADVLNRAHKPEGPGFCITVVDEAIDEG